METKHIIALVALVALTCGSVLLAAFFQRMRDVVFFLMIATAGVADRFDANFGGENWYRGTTRGVGVGVVDVMALSLVIATLVAPRHGRKAWFVPATFGVFSIYGLYCAASLLQAPQWVFGAWELANIPRAMLVMLAATLFVSTRREVAIMIGALGCAVAFQVLIAVKQRFLEGMWRPYGTLDHANSLSMYLCLVTPVLVAAAMASFSRGLRWFAVGCVALAAGGVVLTLSRAGVPTFALTTLGVALAGVTWQLTRAKVLAAMGGAAFFGIVLASSWDQLGARYAQTTLTKEYLEVEGENRGVYWRWAGMMVADHPFGVGLNNWSYTVSKTYGARLGFPYEDYDRLIVEPDRADLPSIRYAPPAHSLIALTLGELGVLGVVLFGAVWVAWFRLGASFLPYRLLDDPMQRVGVGIFFGTLGIFLQSVTEWTYRQPAMFLTFHTLIGALAGLEHARRCARSTEAQPAGEAVMVQSPTLSAARLGNRVATSVSEWRV